MIEKFKKKEKTMSKEILFKTDQNEQGTVVTVEEKDVPASTREKDGRYKVIAYSKTEKGNHLVYSPLFWINKHQRVPVETWAKNGKVHGGSLFNPKGKIGHSIPPGGGIFDLIPGYWRLSVTGTYYPPGGIFASATYTNDL
jgi:hypothetical protein